MQGGGRAGSCGPRHHLAVVLDPLGQALAERRRGARLAKGKRRDQVARRRRTRLVRGHDRLRADGIALEVRQRLLAAQVLALQAGLGREKGAAGAGRRQQRCIPACTHTRQAEESRCFSRVDQPAVCVRRASETRSLSRIAPAPTGPHSTPSNTHRQADLVAR